jgi:hypothetical protein
VGYWNFAMNRLGKLLHLSIAECWLLLKAALLLALTRVALVLLPYSTVRVLIDRMGRRSSRLGNGRPPAEHLAWAVSVASRVVPRGEHCLTQALSLRTLLARRGYDCRICYGVQKAADSPLRAHAWVEYNGAALIGGGDLNHFNKLGSSTNPSF